MYSYQVLLSPKDICANFVVHFPKPIQENKYSVFLMAILDFD